MALRSELVVADSAGSLSPSLAQVCAVIITYQPRTAFLSNLFEVVKQVDYVIVVDNGSSGEAAKLLAEAEVRGAHIIRNPRNLGIAVALNQGIQLALARGVHWILTLDQDSRVAEGFVREMLRTFEGCGNRRAVALVAPSYVDQQSGIRVQSTRTRNGTIITAMTSGCLMPEATIRALGPFDESLFMDYVDTDFCLRARRNGMVILQSPAELLHSLGRTTFHHFLGRRYGVTNHSWQRRYYITRNRLRLLQRYFDDWPWVWRETRALFLQGAKIVFVEQDKWMKFRAMASGTAHAFLGKTGKQVEL